MKKLWKISILVAVTSLLLSCEEVITIDLNTDDPAFVAEGVIYKDSVCTVRLTSTSSFFSTEGPDVIDDAVVLLSNETTSEVLAWIGNGYYRGNTITGTEGSTYEIGIEHDGKTYSSISKMPRGAAFNSVTCYKSDEVSFLNPYGDTVYTFSCRFDDDPFVKNYYMICFYLEGDLIEERYFLMTESSANGGSLEKAGNEINFSESIFFPGGEVEVQLFTIDEPVYNYFMQLDDILFWKRRYVPPVPYNPGSNLSDGALGYFAAWTFDTRRIMAE